MMGSNPKSAGESLLDVQTEAGFRQGLALHRQGQLAQAQEIYRQVLSLHPRHFEALHLLGVIAAQMNDPARAVELIDQAIEIDPGSAMAHFNRGNALKDLRQYHEAIEAYDKAIALKPDYAAAYNGLGNALQSLKQHFSAIASYEKAIAVKPDYIDAYSNLGAALVELNQYRPAFVCYDMALNIRPGDTLVLSKRSMAQVKLRQHQIALHRFGNGLVAEVDFSACFKRGNELFGLKQYPAAIENYEEAFALKPDFAEAYCGRGAALFQLGLHQAAIDSYDRAIALKPDFAQAHYNCGNALAYLKQPQAALASYEKAFALRPDTKYLCGAMLYMKMQLCDWRDAEKQVADLLQRIRRGEKASPPFAVLAITASLALQRKAAAICIGDENPFNPALGQIAKHARGQKIRIGYFSMDFGNHPVAFLTAELFEMHDRDRFEVFAFSFGLDKKDEMRARLEAAFDEFIDVKDLSDQQIAELSRQREIDIAIDLAGFTGDSRTGIFALRAAPIQVSYLGYPGTMGADYIDYLIADRTLIPEHAKAHYAEQIVYLPDTYMANDSKRAISDRKFTRVELGLPATGFVFCCFNNSYKITPDTFDGWMRILSQVGGSVLWLAESTSAASTHLRKEAMQRGIDPQRLVFAQKMPLLADHLARHRAADLFIDTLPCNAHTTASDALWAGLPVLTCTGEAFASRVAASLLNAIALPELITSTQADYEALAVELASNSERLLAIRKKLDRNRLSTALFDTRLFTRHIEAAYSQMFERYQADLPPEHIEVGQTRQSDSAI